MAKRRKPKYRKQNSSSPLVLGLVAVMAVLVLFSLGLRMLLGTGSAPAPEIQIQSETIPTETEPAVQRPSLWQRLFGKKDVPAENAEPELVLPQASICVTGDVLMHMPVIDTGLQSNGQYDFSSIFRYLLPYSAQADFAVANLETTLCGTEGGYRYSGYPAFNCPDEIVDALKDAGFDLLLTANNHCYDTKDYGFQRTVRTIREKGLLSLGTMESPQESKFLIREINGIRVGMTCYTYEGAPENPEPGKVYMNRVALSDAAAMEINSFLPGQTEPFFQEIQNVMTQMRNADAEATMLFIHWGVEYQTAPNAEQQAMAQRLCDLGFDVIVGGHPHVIQPVSLLTSRTDPEHKTVCLYSTGNAVSNQRISEMDLKTGHTEDALLFTVTFARYPDNRVYLESAELLPCWVDLRNEADPEYPIIPLHSELTEQWQALYSLTDEAAQNAQRSYQRTVDITGTGMAQVQTYLTEQQALRRETILSLPDAA